MKELVIYVHGKGGKAEEAEHYKPLFPKSDETVHRHILKIYGQFHFVKKINRSLKKEKVYSKSTKLDGFGTPAGNSKSYV